MYDPTNYPNNKVEVELKETSNDVMSFLDYKLIFKNNFITITDNNTNVSCDMKKFSNDGKFAIVKKEENLWKRRYPSVESNYDKSVYHNTMVNVFMKTRERNNNSKFYIFSQICNVIEFMCLKYTSKIIVNCLFNVDRLLAITLMRMIRGGLCCSRECRLILLQINS